MKRTIIILTFVLVAGVTFAQKGKVTSASSLKDAGKVAEAFKAIETAIDPDNSKSVKSIPWPKTWEVRGDVYQAIFRSKDENIKKLSDDPLTVALSSYKKAMELDEKGKLDKSIKIKLTFLQQDLTNQAIEAFNNENYDKALLSFEQLLEVGDIPVIKADNPNVIDTAIIYNAGLAAYSGKKYDTAIKYYKEVAKYGYNKGKTYIYIAYSYKFNNDTVNALTSLQEGFSKYPDDNDIITEMVSIYLQTDKKEDAIKYLELAIAKDDSNPKLYFAQGATLDKLGKQEEAIKSYEKALELNPEYFDVYFNLGALYFNKGVEQHEIALQVPPNDNKKYEEEIAKCDQWWDKSLPYMEKCKELINNGDITVDEATNRSVLETLKNIYYRLIPRDEAKWKKLYDEMESLLNK